MYLTGEGTGTLDKVIINDNVINYNDTIKLIIT